MSSGKKSVSFTCKASSSISGGVSYAVYAQNRGWLSVVSSVSAAGTAGSGQCIEAIKMSLTGDISNAYDIYNQGMFNNQDGRLAQNLSHGCVRLAIQDAKWIYDNIPYGTKAVTYR